MLCYSLMNAVCTFCAMILRCNSYLTTITMRSDLQDYLGQC